MKQLSHAAKDFIRRLTQPEAEKDSCYNQAYMAGRIAGRDCGSTALYPGCSHNYGAGVVHGALERLEKGKQL